MLQRQVFLVCVGSFVASLFLLSGCGEQKTKPIAKTDKVVVAIKSGKATTKTTLSPSSIDINPSFEKAKVFDSGIYKKGKTPIEKPLGWTTKGQVLDDFTGWATDEAHTGKRSLKIKNIGGTDANWEGKPIIFKRNINALKISIWTKADEIAKNMGKGKFQLAFDVYLSVGGKAIKKRITIAISQNDHIWKQTTKKVLFAENITKIVPYLYFSGMTGSIWFDDFSINPINTDLSKGKVLFDSNDKKSTFNIPPFSTPINPKSLPDDLSVEAKEIALEEQTTIYKVKGSKTMLSSGFLAIKKKQIYRLSGMFKSDGETKSLLYLGYTPYTRDKKFIIPQSVSILADTGTELSKPCLKGDIILYIKDGANWITNKPVYVAFDADNSGSLSDLPNFKLSKINKIEKDNDNWKIFLVKPCAKNYPANTKVREHSFGSYEYIASCHVPNTWTEYTEIITVKKEFINGGSLFPPGTSYIKISILANLGQSKETLLLKNISFGKIIIP